VNDQLTLSTAELTAVDRCDRCGAQAYVRALLPSGSDLLFCGHHGKEYSAGLRAVSANISDQTARLFTEQ
jgi:hypothetical protein